MEAFDFVRNMPTDEQLDERVNWYVKSAQKVQKNAHENKDKGETYKLLSEMSKLIHAEHRKYSTNIVSEAIKDNSVAQQYIRYITDVSANIHGKPTMDTMNAMAFEFEDYTRYGNYPRYKG